MKNILLILFFLTLTLMIFTYNIEIVTEQYPPFNYEQEGIVGGVSTEILKEVLKELSIETEINVMRWSSAYRRAQRRPNVLIYSIGRTPEREDDFHWIGVVAPFDIYFYSLSKRTDIIINNINDLKKYTIGVVRNDMRHQYLNEIGGFKIITYRGTLDIFDALIEEKIDLMPVAELNFPYIVEHANNYMKNFKKVFFLEELSKDGLYMAFSKNTDLNIVEDFKKALKKIKEDGLYEEIIRKYIY